MNSEMLEKMLVRLERRLGLEELDDETTALLEDELWDAEGEILLYLDCQELDKCLLGKVVELAEVYYWRDQAENGGLKSRSYTEGQISQSETYQSAQEYRAAVEEILHSIARYRRVSC
jgi:hypothetical protein